jgi:hypothetical protein
MRHRLLLTMLTGLGPAAAVAAAEVPLPRARPAPVAAAPPEAAAPARSYQTACPAVLAGRVTATALPPIADGQCRLQSPLRLEAVSANGRTIPLSSPVTADCGMATALPAWVASVDSYALATENTRLATLETGTGYACRNVNNAADGNLSFHAFGDALDVTGFGLEDGRTLRVETAWQGTAAEGRGLLRFAHAAACAQFTTVLGPDANALHHDHLHLDLGCHGARCVARLCE